MVDQRKPRRTAAGEKRLNLAFHALADPSRRRIIELLRMTDELKVGDIAQAFAMSLNGVSKHLKVLEAAGLVRRRIAGRAHWIRVDWPALQQPYDWLHFYHHFWAGRLDALAEYADRRNEKNQ